VFVVVALGEDRELEVQGGFNALRVAMPASRDDLWDNQIHWRKDSPLEVYGSDATSGPMACFKRSVIGTVTKSERTQFHLLSNGAPMVCRLCLQFMGPTHPETHVRLHRGRRGERDPLKWTYMFPGPPTNSPVRARSHSRGWCRFLGPLSRYEGCEIGHVIDEVRVRAHWTKMGNSPVLSLFRT
jgi:hypothetical protein